jgi:hypothetical protein
MRRPSARRGHVTISRQGCPRSGGIRWTLLWIVLLHEVLYDHEIGLALHLLALLAILQAQHDDDDDE